MRVQGEGPVPCDICYVGGHPGWEEHRTGRPYVGKVGTEIRRLIELHPALPSFDDSFRTDLYREYGGKDYEYTAADLARDAPELVAELDRVRPALVVPLGRDATRYFLGDVDMESVWGLPWQTDQFVCLPIHQPASWNPEQSPYVVAGFQALAAYWQTGQPAPRRLYDDPWPNPVYEELYTEADVLRVTGHWQEGATLIVGLDTEGRPKAPWSLQFSDLAGRGYLIGAGATEALHAFHRLAHRRGARLLFHSALHDLPMMRALGVPWTGPFDDTMVMAYLLQLEPQGLKQGALRLCNMRMDSYEDILGDADNRLAREWLTWLWDSLMFDYEASREAAFAAELLKGRRVKVLPKLPKPPLLRSVERCLASPRPRGLWGDQDDAIQAEGVRRLGFMPEASLSHVSRPKAVRYGCRDADATIRYREQLWPKIQALGLESTYNLEMSTYPLIDRMGTVGIKPDLSQFAALSTALGFEIDRLAGELRAQTEDPGFNANSGDHVAAYLFTKLGLMPLKMTRSGDRGSTNDKILEALERANPQLRVIGAIRQYREFYKLKYTFVDQIPAFLNRWPYDGRIHTTFRTTRVITGRLAASDPNMLAQPEHGAWAEEFKRGWVAEDGRHICQWDESQVELRVLAHMSQDPVMLAVYRGEKRNPDGSLVDLHAALAERIFGVPPHQQSKSKHRLPAKAVNFGIPMGMTKHGLMIELRKNGVDIDEDDAQKWLDETLGLYTGVATYMDLRKAEAARNGYVRCLSGRIRYIGGIHSSDDRVREEAERFAFSTPIQEGATWIMKRAEARIWTDVLPHFWKRGAWVEPILQVHDCLKLEADQGLEQELNAAMSAAMTEPPPGFTVPLAVEGEFGRTMSDMQKF